MIQGVPKIAVHICCAPDAGFSMQILCSGYDAWGFFYNPCIHPREEYDKRAVEMEKLKKYLNIKCEEGGYDPEKWFEKIKGLENEPEGGKRCEICIYMRLLETAKYAKKIGASLFTTVLTNSPRKDVEKVFKAGKIASLETGIPFLPVNFKKHGWYEKGLKISKEFKLYRQNYCGCVFSVKTSPRLKWAASLSNY